MFKTELPIYLASKSPRRKKLLKLLYPKIKTLSVNLNEEILDGEHPIKTVKRLASEKMHLAKKKVKNGVIITADTIVVLDKNIIGKPKSEKDAENILANLSGKTHAVYTGLAIYNVKKNNLIVDYEKTAVTFRELSKKEIKKYVAGGSPMDKAGAYGIQDDYGAVFVKKINGCFYNVMGLPLSKVQKLLLEII